MVRLHRRVRRLPRLLAVLAVLLSLLAVAPPAAVAAGSSVVTNCDDTVGPATPGSLRAAVEAANADGTATALDPHVITFALDPPCALITLAGAQLSLSHHVDIQGPGADALTVSGNNASRVFEVASEEASDVTATISGLTIANGNGGFEGGNIRNRGHLTVRAVVITGGAATFGGGIDSDTGFLTVDSSTLTGNTSNFSGGAIWSGASATIVNSTISENTGTWGAILAESSDATVALINSTVTDNSTTDNTVSGNLMAFGNSKITLSGTIVSNSTGTPNCTESSNGTITSLGNNLENGDTCGLDPTLGDLPNTDPLLGLLDNYGGPTLTHALSPNSPAIDHIAAADCAVTTDQRGVTRPQNELCDIGAYELFFQSYVQACLYGGALTQAQDIGEGPPPPVNCGRGVEVELLAAGDPQFDTLHACLYAGSLTQVGTEPPDNCGRGVAISLAAGDTLCACLYAGRLSQVGGAAPLNCGRGEQIGLAQAIN